ncbi:MAG: metal-dependent hydrolase [Methanobacterium sp. PtaU1.Bin242]|nr:MAG: metal-dependent hydrolase [Methanobacterium sp. PtaU1.Bin242]
MIIRWLGHSAFQIITNHNLKILIDPFISNNPISPVMVEELSTDLIMVTHGHKDHFGDTMEIANRTGAAIIANHENSVYLSKQGFDSLGMNMGGTVEFQDIEVTMVDSSHSSDMDFMDEMGAGGSSCGYIIRLENGRKIYHSGDTGIFGDMKTVIRDIYHPDIALLPIGDRFTMGPREAAIAADWIKPEILIPMHYNTFPVIQQNPLEFAERVEALNASIKVVILEPGEFYEE